MAHYFIKLTYFFHAFIKTEVSMTAPTLNTQQSTERSASGLAAGPPRHSEQPSIFGFILVFVERGRAYKLKRVEVGSTGLNDCPSVTLLARATLVQLIKGSLDIYSEQ